VNMDNQKWLLGEELLTHKDALQASFYCGARIDQQIEGWYRLRSIIVIDEFLIRLTGESYEQ